MQLSFCLSVLFFGIYLISVLVVLRTVRVISPTIVVCGCALLVYGVGLVLIGFLGWQINFFSFSALYWFLTLSLLMFFGAVYKSISLRIMLYLLNKPKRIESYDVILKNYIKNESYINRIEILLTKKMVAKSNSDSFILTNKGDIVARRIKLIQQIFSIKESG